MGDYIIEKEAISFGTASFYRVLKYLSPLFILTIKNGESVIMDRFKVKAILQKQLR